MKASTLDVILALLIIFLALAQQQMFPVRIIHELFWKFKLLTCNIVHRSILTFNKYLLQLCCDNLLLSKHNYIMCYIAI